MSNHVVCANTHRRVGWGTNPYFGMAWCPLCRKLTGVYVTEGWYYYRQHFTEARP
jgi:hypothetical protein